MGSEVPAPMRGAGIPPAWRSVLAVIAHPDDESIGLGPVLDAFMVAGVKVEVLCLTHGQAWKLPGAPGDLAALRGAELASAADVLGPVRTKMQDCPDGCLSAICQSKLATEVVAVADSFHPDGLLAFDTPEATGCLDHVAATAAGVLAAETLGLPVLGWSLSEAVATRLNRESGAQAAPDRAGEVDLRVTIDRARQRVATHTGQGKAPPGSARRRRLELLAETASLRWLRPPCGPGHGASRMQGNPQA
jgi:LmbE family N-acetylglucosaminyl deacetylase